MTGPSTTLSEPTAMLDAPEGKPGLRGWRKHVDALRGHSSQSERLSWLLILLPTVAMAGGFWLVGLAANPTAQPANAALNFASNPLAGPQIALMLIAGLTLMATPRLIERAAGNPRPLIFLVMVLAGIGLRLSTLGSVPFFENDYFRYLWDGHLVANGVSPYWHAPVELSNPGLVMRDRATELLPFAEAAPEVLASINHPWLATIYPPVAQAFFALAHLVLPNSIDGLRLVFTAVDLFNLFLIITVLRHLKRSALWSALYWINPLVIGEVFNSAHMDVLLFPFILLAFLFAAKRWTFLAVSFLSAAVAVKIWPVLLLPLLLRPTWSTSKLKAVRDVLWFGVLSTLMLLPMVIPIVVELSSGLGGPAPSSGTAAYTKTWQMNDSLFQVILAISSGLQNLAALGAPSGDVAANALSGQRLARLIVVAIVGLVALGVALPRWERLDQAFARVLVVIAVLFLLSPTQFPWYALWFLPFLPFVPVNGLLIFSGTLVLYYLRPFFAATDNGADVWRYDGYIVWLAFIPAYLLLIRDLAWRRVRRAKPTS